jgi:hypothetical protein
LPKKSQSGIRRTTHISHRVTQSGFRAFDYAIATDRPLNKFIVIHLRDDTEQCAGASFSKVLHKFRDWLAYQSKRLRMKVSPIYVFTLENPNGSVHVNWALHVPKSLHSEFEKKIMGWVTKVQKEIGPYTVKVKDIDQSYAKRLAKYIFKGTDPRYVVHFHLYDLHAPQGEVWGRRAGISQAIGRKARKRAGFLPGRRSYLPTRQPNAEAAADRGVASPSVTSSGLLPDASTSPSL